MTVLKPAATATMPTSEWLATTGTFLSMPAMSGTQPSAICHDCRRLFSPPLSVAAPHAASTSPPSSLAMRLPLEYILSASLIICASRLPSMAKRSWK